MRSYFHICCFCFFLSKFSKLLDGGDLRTQTSIAESPSPSILLSDTTNVVSSGAFIVVLMSTNPNDVSIPSREQFGLPSTDETRRNQDVPTLAIAAPGVITTGQLDWIMSTIAKLESRMAAADQQAVIHRFPPRPDSAPPYALPLPTAVRENQQLPQPPNTAVTDHQFSPQPSITPPLSHSFPHYPEVTSYNRPPPHGFTPHQPLHNNVQQPLYETDLLGQPRFSHPTMQPQLYHGQYYPSEQPSYWPVTATVPQPPYGHPPLVDAGFHPPHTQPPDLPAWQQPYRPYDWGVYAARQPDAYQPYTQPAYVDGQPYTWKQPQRQYTTSTFGQPPYSSDAAFVRHGYRATSAFSQKPYTAQTTLTPLRTSFVDHQGSLTVDGVGVDLAHQYGSDNEHSSSHASRAEEGDGDAEINDRNVASDDKAMVDYFAAALAGVSVTLDHSTSALVSIVDAVAALSCDALSADVSPFNVMDSGDGSMATDVVALAADFKVFFNSLKLLNSGKKLSDDSMLEILSLHEDFKDVSRSLHSRARVQLNSRFGVVSVKVLSMALGNLALSRLYLGINSIRRTDLLISNSISDVGLCSRFLKMVAAKRLLPALEELLRQAESSIKGRNEARELVELRTYEIAIEVSQVEAAISGLSEEVVKKSEEIESLKKSLLEKEGNVAELGRESMEKQEGMEGELSRLRLLIFDYESKMEMQRPLLIDQLNYVTRLHEEMSKAMKIDEKRHEVFLDSRIFELNCLLASWFPP